MKNIVFTIGLLFFIASCSNDDDNNSENDNNTDNVNDGLISLELNKAFLLNEKWFLESLETDTPFDLNLDGVTSTDLISQVPTCDLDSFYVFEQNSEDVAILNDGDVLCEDFNDKYIFDFFSFNFEQSESGIIELNALGSQLIGGLKDVKLLENSEFLINSDSTFKIIKSEVTVTDDDGNNVLIIYSLKADFDNRP